MKAGAKRWIIPGGQIPLESTGAEPANTSRDVLCVVNINDQDAHLNMTIYYEDRDPVDAYKLAVNAKRTRHIRFNDLIDPEAIPLDTPYAVLIDSDTPVVVQFTRLATGSGHHSFSFMMAYPVL